ncbi:MAG TPA: UvrD-helicase domain-containing protein [Bacteroidaceae bacterium]|nr:UvrD-helicase domain-containing protein [Bacteroidaceae bacterium]
MMNSTQSIFPALTIYRASAGSGKTFMLTVRYISLLIRNPDKYRNILAVTFTNKATNQMKERILSQLYGIHKDLDDSRVYFEEVRKTLPGNFSDATIRYNAGKALNLLLHNFSHFRVETIDSFFQTILRNLAKELRIGSNQTLELDTKRVIEEAVEGFLKSIKPNSTELREVIRFIENHINNQDNWKIDEKLRAFSKQLFQESFLERGESLREVLKKQDGLADYSVLIKKTKEAALNRISLFGKEYFSILPKSGIDSKYIRSDIEKYFNRLIEGDLDRAFSAKRIINIIQGNYTLILKSAPNHDILEVISIKTILPLIERSRFELEKIYTIVNSCDLSIEFLHELNLLTNIRGEINWQNDRKNRFIMSDTSHLLNQLEEGDTSFVFEKTGSFIRHIMVDEFQDTSRLQWRNLSILFLESISQNQESLVVGDIKQSIYRWRNSDWQILNSEITERFKAYNPHTVTLTTNRRSSLNIIEFNNLFFPAAANALNDDFINDFSTPCHALLQAYADVEQQSPTKEKSGFVSIKLITSNENKSEKTPEMLQALAEQFKNLIDSGVRQSDIAILFRKKSDISEAAAYFANNHPELKVISNEAFRLDSSGSVRILINALKWISDSTDTIALIELAWEWQRFVQKEDKSLQDLLIDGAISNLPETFVNESRHLRQTPLFELTERLFVILELEKIEDQDSYIFYFFDSLYDYVKRETNSLENFLDHWNSSMCSETIPFDQLDGVRLMTIHSSKGLEFHTVMLPFCDWEFNENKYHTEQIWCEPSEEPFNKIPLLPISFKVRMNDSIFKEEYINERSYRLIDNLNLLYVAFTRARHNLSVIGHIKERKENIKKISTISDLILTSLGNNYLFKSNGKEYDFISGQIVPYTEKLEQKSLNPFLSEYKKTVVPMVTYKEAFNFRESNLSSKFVRNLSNESDDWQLQEKYIETGNLLHKLFSTIRIASDLDLGIARLVSQGLIESAHKENSIRDLASSALSNPIVQEWFSGKYRLFVENAILINTNGIVQIRRPDRVMIHGDTAIVTDFKFGNPSKEHQQQVYEYISLLKSMGYTTVRGYLWYIFQNRIEECRMV